MYLLMYSLNNSTAPIENFEKAAYTETQNAGFPTHPLDADRFSVHEEDMTQQLFDVACYTFPGILLVYACLDNINFYTNLDGRILFGSKILTMHNFDN